MQLKFITITVVLTMLAAVTADHNPQPVYVQKPQYAHPQPVYVQPQYGHPQPQYGRPQPPYNAPEHGEHEVYGDHEVYGEHAEEAEPEEYLEAKDENDRYLGGIVDPSLKEPVVSFKDKDDPDNKWINSRWVDANFILGFLFFTYHMLRPADPVFLPIGRENGPPLTDMEGFPIPESIARDYINSIDGNGDFTDMARQLADNPFNELYSNMWQLFVKRVNPVGRALDYMAVSPQCQRRTVCEGRALLDLVPLLGHTFNNYRHLAGPMPGFEHETVGASGRTDGGGTTGTNTDKLDCTELYQEECTNGTSLTGWYNMFAR